MFRQLFNISLVLSLSACANDSSLKVHAVVQQTQKNMVFVKGGSFLMGDVQAIDNENFVYGDERWVIGSPENKKKYPDARWLPITMGHDDDFVHKVTLSDFYMQKYEVTWGEFDVYSVANGKELADKDAIGKYKRRDSQYPTEAPSWDEAKNYCLWLGKETGKHYDLPTEAQWEYAARSRGKYVAYATNDGEGRKNKYRYKKPKNGTKDELNISPRGGTIPGTYPPNPLGLYDMTGNTSEWLNDWYDKDYYKNSTECNPQGPKTGEMKSAKRGDGDLSFSTVYERTKFIKNNPYSGFRCVINP